MPVGSVIRRTIASGPATFPVMNKMNPRLGILIGALPLAISVTPAVAWDECGHKIVATIAYEELSPAVKQKVDKIFANDPRHRKFIDDAGWADGLRQGKNNKAPKVPFDAVWHYVDVVYDADESQITDIISNDDANPDPKHPATGNVVSAITYYTELLQSNRGTKAGKADALCFLIHYVGDAHQPLHCATVTMPLSNYTPPDDGDRGGNGFLIEHRAKKLHAFWDEIFDEPTTGAGRDHSNGHAKQVADNLRTTYHSDPAAVADDEPADWARESFSYHEFAYSPPAQAAPSDPNKLHTISPAYIAQAEKISGSRLVLAGDRLAALLESIYSP